MLTLFMFISSVASSTVAAAGSSWVDTVLQAVLDPSWNVEYRLLIWVAIVVVLFLSGVGLPLPEDIPLTVAGFTTIRQAHDVFSLPHYAATFAIVVTPILLGDMIAYGLGRRYGLGLRERVSLLRRALSPSRLQRVQRWFDSYGAFTVFLGRQVAGVRFVTFFTAGTMRVGLPKFVFFDFLGCLVSVPVWLTLGFLASRYGEAWLQIAMRRVGRGFLAGALLVFVGLFVFAKLRGRKGAANKPAVGDSSSPS